MRKPRIWHGPAWPVRVLRAKLRLDELARLAGARHRAGVLTDTAGWCRVAASAVVEMRGYGRWLDEEEGVRGQLPPGEAPAVLAPRHALDAAVGQRRLISGREAGRLLAFSCEERDLMAALGWRVRTITPVDETPKVRADRKREQSRIRNRRRRERLKNEAASRVPHPNVVTGGHDISGRYASPLRGEACTKPNVAFYAGGAPALVAAALSPTPQTAAEIAHAVARPAPTVRRALERFVVSGVAKRVSRGRYVAAPRPTLSEGQKP